MQISNQKTSAPDSIQLAGGSVHIHTGGSSNKCDRPTTTLERCRDQAMDNMHSVNEIHSRILALLNRLRGPEPRIGSGGEGETEPRGMLVVHLELLEYEAQRLGEIQADLAVLEELL